MILSKNAPKISYPSLQRVSTQYVMFELLVWLEFWIIGIMIKLGVAFKNSFSVDLQNQIISKGCSSYRLCFKYVYQISSIIEFYTWSAAVLNAIKNDQKTRGNLKTYSRTILFLKWLEYIKVGTVYPHIVSAETILFWIWKSKGHST